MSKGFKKIGAAIVDIVVVMLILLSVIISISSITAKANNGVPDLFGYTPFSVQTNSMSPTLEKGDYIFVEECDPATLQENDIISFFTIIDGQRVINTHRIVKVENFGGVYQFTTKGDHNSTEDESVVLTDDIIGKYTGTAIPVLGSVIDYLSTQMGFFLVILLPVLLFTLYQIYKLIKVIMYNHKVDTINAANEATSDEVKEAIIAEYLAKQKEQEALPSQENELLEENQKETEDN